MGSALADQRRQAGAHMWPLKLIICSRRPRRKHYNLVMTDSNHFLLFLGAAVVLAITPGPGIFYVLARTLAGGRREGIKSALGKFFCGLFHLFAAGPGRSAILAASALAVCHVEDAG